MNPKDHTNFQDSRPIAKRYMLSMPEKMAADLAIRLSHESITTKRFFMLMIEGYLKDDKRLLSYLDEAMKGVRPYYQTQLLIKERLKINETVEKFGLDPDEIEDIYDIMEEELNEYR